MYLTYEEYTAYGGKLGNTDFDRFSYRAESELNSTTFDRIKSLLPIPECVKRCEFELILYLSQNAKGGDAASISSVSNDGYSISYGNSKSAEQVIYDIIYTYLGNTGLMYCGTDEIKGYNFVEPIPNGTAYLLVKTE